MRPRVEPSRTAPAADRPRTANIRPCPQKLSLIRGIGPVYERRLYDAGIGAFWQVAQTPSAELARILDIRDFQRVDLEGIRREAQALAEATDTLGQVWSGERPDDFDSLPGMGPTYLNRLYDAGVCTWEHLAATTPEELAAIVQAPSWNQPDFAAWIETARQQRQPS